MPKVKAKRQSVSLDMTAMCDVAFLLLTFFMLTAKFKPEEAVTITPPSSISEKPLPTGGTGFLTVSVGPDGGIYLGTDDNAAKKFMLERMANRYGLAITPTMQKNYNASELIGYPAGAMRQILNMTPSEAKAAKLLKGIPCDSTVEGNELFLWVNYAKLSNPALQVAIKGDANSNYKVFNQIVGTLQGQNINKFQLVTSPENKPK